MGFYNVFSDEGYLGVLIDDYLLFLEIIVWFLGNYWFVI